jgi:hypothetical protein
MVKGGWKFEEEQGYLTNADPIDSVSQLVDCVDYVWFTRWRGKDSLLEEESPWFRGVSRAGYKLIPSVYRKDVWKYNWMDADDIRGEFPRRAAPFIEQCRFYSEGELYHIMQHYGLPTRLLDWTEGVLLALYFAIRETSPANKVHDPKPKEHFTPCIWMLNPRWLNEKSTKKRELFYSHFRAEDKASRRIVSPYLREKGLPDYPVAVLPPHIDRRIVAQKSVFTIHGRKQDGIADLCARYKDAQLAKLHLDGNNIETLKDQLITAGIKETSVFPDLEGLSREIKLEYDMS